MEELNLASVEVGAKGTIVSLMAMELQLRQSPRIHHSPIRREAVSLYCLSNSKNTPREKSRPLKSRRSKEDLLSAATPGTFERRKRAVSHPATGKMFSLETDRAPAARAPSRKERAVDDLIPILSAREQQKTKKVQSYHPPSPGKPHVKIVDTRCYAGGRELFRQASSGSPSKFSFSD